MASQDGKPCWQDNQAAGMSFDFMDTVSTTSSAVTDQITTNVASYKAGSATAPVARTMTATLRDKFGDVVPNATLGANFYGGAPDVAVVEGDLSSDDEIDLGGAVNGTMPVDTKVCFGTIGGVATAVVGLSPGVVYYVKNLADSNEEVGLSLTPSTGTNAKISLTGASAVTDFLALAHPTLGRTPKSDHFGAL